MNNQNSTKKSRYSYEAKTQAFDKCLDMLTALEALRQMIDRAGVSLKLQIDEVATQGLGTILKLIHDAHIEELDILNPQYDKDGQHE